MSSYFKTIKNTIHNEWKKLIENSLMPKCKRTYMSASSTVEASLVMPIFIYAIVVIIYIMQFIAFYINVEISIYNTARKMAVMAYESSVSGNNHTNNFYDNESMSKVAIKASIISDLKNGNALNNNVVGGPLGMSVLNSTISHSEITIVASYMLKSPFDIFKLSVIPVTHKVSTKPWTGVDTDERTNLSNSQYVYIIENGTVYHKTKKCTYLTVNLEEIDIGNIGTVRNESGGIYYPCEQCGKVDLSGYDKVFITKYGNRYHLNAKCTRIKRNILTIDIKNVGDRRKCSKCY